MLSAAQKILLDKTLQQVITNPARFFNVYPVGGGSINDTYRVNVDNNLQYFVKLNSNSRFEDFFEKEKHGLGLLRKQNIIRVPEVVAGNSEGGTQLLLMEWIDTGAQTENFWTNFGRQLAMLHCVSSGLFGLDTDNYMGSLPQSNSYSDNWTGFFIHSRLMPQIKLAAGKKLLEKKHQQSFEKLYIKLNSIFNKEKPALLHGDLWSGNFMCDRNAQPVLIDPAVYFGHRSMDLAMTTLFGGFDQSFYDAYHHHFPFPHNYREQWDVCNLYPLLIHLNLFGRSYLQSIVSILKKYA